MIATINARLDKVFQSQSRLARPVIVSNGNSFSLSRSIFVNYEYCWQELDTLLLLLKVARIYCNKKNEKKNLMLTMELFVMSVNMIDHVRAKLSLSTQNYQIKNMS